MVRHTKKDKPSPQTLAEAEAIAKRTQRPGQSKEQTKLIAQGIQKGIDQYKKQQKSRARELNKKLKHASKKGGSCGDAEVVSEVIVRHHWLPWVLLLLSWTVFAFVLLGRSLS
jgi:hypothetical protein